MRAIKVLSSQPGDGEQLVHFDSLAGYTSQHDFTFLAYCTPGTQSTAFSRFPLSFLPDSGSDADELQAKHGQIYDKRWYHSVPVQTGDIAFFSERAPHFGVQNTSNRIRRVVFALVSGNTLHRTAQKQSSCCAGGELILADPLLSAFRLACAGQP